MGKENIKKLGLVCLTAVSLASMSFALPGDAVGDVGQLADLRTADTGDATAIVNTGANLPWYLEKIGADRGWALNGGGKHVVVAVLDTGIDDRHEELAGKILNSVNFTSSPTAFDVNGHGTLIAGIITASLKDLKGATGVAYDSLLLNVKIASDSGFINPEDLAKGIIWAADHGADVINLSLTLNQPVEAVEKAVAYAWDKGCLIVAAAGNTGGTRQIYPAAYPNVIAVGATDKSDRMARWSNRGDWVEVNAPGEDIYSTSPGNNYVYKSGTSFAAPLVAGEAALLYAIARDENNNGFLNDEVRTAILEDVQPLTGTGRTIIDVQQAVGDFIPNDGVP